MEIVKTPSEFGHKDIRIVESEDKHLDIVFGGTGDIYWIYDNQEEFFTEEDPMYDSFAMPAREEGLYAIFEELYNDLINGNIYHPEQIPDFYKIADPNAQEKENQRCIQSNKDIKIVVILDINNIFKYLLIASLKLIFCFKNKHLNNLIQKDIE